MNGLKYKEEIWTFVPEKLCVSTIVLAGFMKKYLIPKTIGSSVLPFPFLEVSVLPKSPFLSAVKYNLIFLCFLKIIVK